MQYIEAISNEKPKFTSVFLAGGITNCPDWQNEIVDSLKNTDITIFNPRRKNFPIHDPNASFEQIKWEFQKLREADILSFWFSRGSLNPIVLFEYGSALEREKSIIVGVDPNYERKRDVEIQTSLIRPRLEIVTSIKDLTDEISSEFVYCHL